MMLHILKKDWQLLWKAVVGVAIVNAVPRLLPLIVGGYEYGRNPLADMANVFRLVALLASSILIVLAVHQDALPGLRQDWLIRPVARRDLLLSKLLFVALLLQGPIFMADLCAELADGLPLWPSIWAALSASLLFFIAFDLPLVAIAALTRNLIEVAGAALLVLFGYVLLFVVPADFPSTMGTGISWITDWTRTAWSLAVTAVILTLQYRRRKTTAARWTWGAGFMVWLLLQFLPWQAAFAIEEKLSSAPADANSVHIAFAPERGRLHREPPNPGSIRFRKNVAQRATFLYIPIRIAGTNNQQMLLTDRAELRFTTLAGTPVSIEPEAARGNFQENPNYQAISVSADRYDRVKDQHLRLDIDYSLTLLKSDRTQTMPAVNADGWIPEVGRCRTETDPERTQVEVRCVAPHRPNCVVWELQNQEADLRGGIKRSGCEPEYAPRLGVAGSDLNSRFVVGFPYRDASEESRLKSGQIVARIYRPVVHFTRHLVIQDLRLSDWRADSSAPHL